MSKSPTRDGLLSVKLVRREEKEKEDCKEALERMCCGGVRIELRAASRRDLYRSVDARSPRRSQPWRRGRAEDRPLIRAAGDVSWGRFGRLPDKLDERSVGPEQSATG